MTFYKHLLIGFIFISFTQAIQSSQQRSTATATVAANQLQKDLSKLFLKATPKTFKGLIQVADAYYETDHFKHAYKCCENIPLEKLGREETKKLFRLHSSSLSARGLRYAQGKGVKQNRKKAFAYFEKAVSVDPSNKEAIQNLSECYKQGFGTEKDPIRAAILAIPDYVSAIANPDTDAIVLQTARPVSVAKAIVEILSALSDKYLQNLENTHGIQKGTLVQHKQSLSEEESSLVIEYFLALCYSRNLSQLHIERILQLFTKIVQAFPINALGNPISATTASSSSALATTAASSTTTTQQNTTLTYMNVRR